MGEQCLGVVQGVAVGEGVAGCVGVSGVWRKPAPVPPTFLQTHPFLVPSGKCHLSHDSKFSAQGREHASCLSLSGQKWGKGSFLAPNRQGQGSHLWLMSQQPPARS